MIASQIAISACLGCVPIDTSVQVERLNREQSNHQFQMTHTPAPVDNAVSSIVTPQLTSSATSAADWAISDEMIAIQLQEESTPRPLRFEPAELFTAKMTFTARSIDTGLGLDMSLAPHATFEKRGQFSTARAGAELRLGQGLEDVVSSFDQRGEDVKINSWYVFAATDGEALCWDLGDNGAKLEGVALRDQVTVGDVQAGFAVQRAGGELSIGYVHREYHHEEASASEGFAALSFTMRR